MPEHVADREVLNESGKLEGEHLRASRYLEQQAAEDVQSAERRDDRGDSSRP